MANWHFLEWKNRFEGPLDQPLILDGVYDPVSFPDQDTQITVRLSISLAEFTKLYSAIIKGAILSYPDEYEQIAWSFLKAFEMPEPFDPCADVEDCIEGSEGVRQTIQDIVLGGTTPPGGSIYGQNNDLDKLFGMIRFLVDTMHDSIVDVFEIAGVASDLRQRARLFLEAIPGAELLPFDEAAEYIDDLLSGIGAEFDAQWTTTPSTGSRDRISCGLFCLAQANDNTLTWAMIRDYFWGLVAYESSIPNQFADFVGYLITNSWAGQDIVNISFANLAAAMDASGRYGDLLFPALATIMQLGANNPDPDWSIICEECPETWMHCIAFAEEPGPFGPYGGFSVGTPGTWNSGDGWEGAYCVAGSTAYHMVQIGFEFETPTTITKMRFKGSVVNGTQGGLPFILGTNTGELLNAGVQPDGEFELEGTGEAVDATVIYLRAQSGSQTGATDPGGIVIVRELCVWGDGPNPFEEGAGLRRAAPTWPILPKPGDVRPEGF